MSYGVNIMEKQNKKYLRILVLVQIVICFLIFIILFLLSRNISSHNIDILHTIAINDAKKYMNTVVDDTIVKIDLKRGFVTNQMNDLADVVSYHLDSFGETNLDKSIYEMKNKLKNMKYGKSIQILIVDKNEDLKDSYTIYRRIYKLKYDLIVCVDQNAIDEMVKSQIYEELHKSIYNENDYIWVNEILNYGGGDRYAIRVIHPNLSNSEGVYLSTFTRDIALLDIMMPLMNGYELTQNIRKISNIPILILSAKDQDSDKILGLNIGADDYLTKPFNPIEVIARINSNLRRFYQLGGEVMDSLNNIINEGELYLNLNELIFTKKGMTINLTPTEYRILAKLMKSPGRIYAKSQLYESVNGEFSQSDDSTMMVHISNLREKIEDDPKNPRYIKTVRGIGYKFELQK